MQFCEIDLDSFSDELCQFLVGKSIPSHITGLPAHFLSTPLGQAVRPMIENMFGKSAHSNSQESLESLDVRSCTHLRDLQHLIATHSCVVVDFTSANCGPCQVISPKFKEMIQEANRSAGSTTEKRILGITVETSVARDICSVYQITATPTFMFFYKGNKTSEFRGANVQELKTQIDLLLFTAYPPHRHAKLDTKPLELFARDYVHYSVSSNIDAIAKKLASLLESHPTLIKSCQPMFEWIKATQRPLFPFEVVWSLVKVLPVEHWFPVLDILRLAVLDKPSKTAFLSKHFDQLVILLLAMKHSAGRPTLLMTMRLLCNLFDSQFDFIHQLSSHQKAKEALNHVIVENLLSEHDSLRQIAAVLVFNLALGTTKLLQGPRLDEEWVSEWVAALGNALEREAKAEKYDNETAKCLLCALGYLLVYADDSILEIAKITQLDLHMAQLDQPKRGEQLVAIKKLLKLVTALIQ